MAFKVGEVVKLKSGGPKMVISEISENGSARCEWFDKAKHLSAKLTIEILEAALDDDAQPGIDVSVLMDVADAIRSRQPAKVELPTQSRIA